MRTLGPRILVALLLTGGVAQAARALPGPSRARPLVGARSSSSVPVSTTTPEGTSDRWTRIAPGIRHLHRTTADPLSIHVIEVDLRAPGVSIEVTPHEQRWLTTSQFGRTAGAVAAVNGGFWSVFDAKAEGLVMHGGRMWPGARDDEFYGFFAVTRDGRAEISPAAQVVTKGRARLLEAISGLQRMLHQGKVTREAYCADGCRFRHPRTAVGVSADGHRVLLAVVEGRLPHSRGISLEALGEHLAGLGAADAINLDGGGSAALYLATRKGLASQPADRREREVLNHVGVFWRPTAAQLADWRAEQARRAAASSGPSAARSGARSSAAAPGGLSSQAPASPGGFSGALAQPPVPSRVGVPTGFARFFQRHVREVLSIRNLLLVVPLIGLFALCLVGVIRRRRRRRASPGSRPLGVAQSGSGADPADAESR